MKKYAFVKLLLLAAAYVLLTMAQCNPDDGIDIDPRDKYIGDWSCTETSTQNPNPMTFNVNIVKEPLTENEIFVHNFYHLGFNEKALLLVNGTNLNIPVQTVCGLIFNGEGGFAQNKINLTYTVNDGADIDTVSAVLSR